MEASASYGFQRTQTSLSFQQINPEYFSDIVLEMRQPFLRGFGIDNAVMWRGYPSNETTPSEAYWRAPDGSEVLAALMVLFEMKSRQPVDLPAEGAARRKALWTARRERLWMASVYVCSFIFIVMVTAGTLALHDGAEVNHVTLAAGDSYVRPKGVTHDVMNATDQPLTFVEVEMKW